MTGEVASVEKKGKLTSVVVKGDGEEWKVDLTPKVQLEISSEGDSEFLRQGIFVRIEAVEVNGKLFGSKLDVYPQWKGNIPPATVIKPPAVPGAVVSQRMIAGQIVTYVPPMGEEKKYGQLELKHTGRSTLSVMIEPEHKLAVIQNDAKLIETGQKATITGQRAGKKFIPQKLAITTGQQLKAQDVLPEPGSKKKKK